MTDTDAVFATLAARRRRYVLYHLLEAGGEATLCDLAGLIAAAEAGRPAGSVPAARTRVALELDRTHLPLLDSRGLVAYDHESGRVRLTDESAAATPYLELASLYERPPTASVEA